MDKDVKEYMMVIGTLIVVAIIFAAISLIGTKVMADIEIQKAKAGITNCEEKKGQ